MSRELAELELIKAYEQSHMPHVDRAWWGAMWRCDYEREMELLLAEEKRMLSGGSGMRFAYADPPYIGQAQKHYSHDSRCAEVDHAALICHMESDYSDGWALSLSVPSLHLILPMCPERARVMAWVKPFAAFKVNVGLAYAWEPIIICGGRKIGRKQNTVRDWHSAPITLRKGLCGAKPKSFCHWILDALNFQPGDELDDLFPGTGVMGQCVAERSLTRVPEHCDLFAGAL